MLVKLGVGVAVAAVGWVLIAAQGPAKAGVDPTTGVAGEAPALRRESPGSTFIQGTGAGEVIGYTTDAVISHYITLEDLTQAFDELVADGHTLVPIRSLTPASLAPLDCLYVGLVDVGYKLSKEQIDAIEIFVRHGGKLVFQGENNVAFHENNVAIGARFRIGFPTNDPPQNVLTDVNAHPITQGPHGAVGVVNGSRNGPSGYGSMLSPGPNGFSLVDFTTGESGGIVIEPGNLGPASGLVVFFAEINVWTDNAYLDGDNRALWRNTFAYDPAPAPAGANQGLKPGLRALLAQS
jgi:hypothetical protein